MSASSPERVLSRPLSHVFYIVEDDLETARSWRRALREIAPSTITRSVAEARANWDPDRAIGLIVDQALPDGRGVDLLSDLLARRHVCAALVTGCYEHRLPNSAKMRGADYFDKPWEHAEMLMFAARALSFNLTRNFRVADLTAECALRWQLTAREIRIFAAHLPAPVSRRHVATSLNVRENTVKGEIKRILAKAAARDPWLDECPTHGPLSLERLIGELLRELLGIKDDRDDFAT